MKQWVKVPVGSGVISGSSTSSTSFFRENSFRNGDFERERFLFSEGFFGFDDGGGKVAAFSSVPIRKCIKTLFSSKVNFCSINC